MAKVEESEIACPIANTMPFNFENQRLN